MGESVSGVVSIMSLLAVLYVFTVENGLVCYICLDGVIWASETVVEVVA